MIVETYLAGDSDGASTLVDMRRIAQDIPPDTSPVAGATSNRRHPAIDRSYLYCRSSLKAVARDSDLEYERISRLHRKRGVSLRTCSPSGRMIRLMRGIYEWSTSLRQIDDQFRYTATTVSKHLRRVNVVVRGAPDQVKSPTAAFR